MAQDPARTVFIPWYSARLYARLRSTLVDGRTFLPGSYEQWSQGETGRMDALRHAGYVVIRFDVDVDDLLAYMEAGRDEADYGSWREWLLAPTRRR